MGTLKLAKTVYAQILATVGKRPPECGGVLGSLEEGYISEYYFDENGTSSENGYVPDVQGINEMLMYDWMPRGVLMVGIVHSHGNMNRVPSCGDISYGIRILQALDTVDHFYLPILTCARDDIFLDFYVIKYDCERQFTCQKVDYMIADGSDQSLS